MEYFRHYRLVLLLIVLVGLNVYYFWPTKKTTQTGFPHPPGGMPPMGQPSAEMEARIKALPEDQQTAIKQRMQQDKEFFASIGNLSDSEKQQKIHDYMSKNPPPAGMFPGGPPGSKDGPGGPPPGGPGDTPHIPPPDVRRDMDQHLVDAMKNSSAS
jgi:hypothetical protein